MWYNYWRRDTAQKRWPLINAPELVERVIEGVKFENGKEVKTNKKKQRKVAA